MADIFENIKVGDKVVSIYRDHNRSIKWIKIREVTHVTQKQFTCADYSKFRKDGKMIGGYRETAEPITVELRAEISHFRKVVSAIKALDSAAKKLSSARGDDALRLLTLLPDELKGNQ